MHLHQRTVNSEVSCTGIGLHTGKKVTMCIRPLPANSGIRFCRVDHPDSPSIPARLEHVVDTKLATTLGSNGQVVSTVEHLMSAFAGMGIDNALVTLDGPEVPIMDGSAGPFVYLLKKVGVSLQPDFKRFLLIKKPLTLQRGDRRVSVYPGRELKVTYTIDFNHPLLCEQTYVLEFSGHSYIREISRARTFGFLKDVEILRNNGFARGGSLESAIVLDDCGVLNAEGLRYEDEFVRHKVLDFVGDLYLLGMPVIGHFVVQKSGHALNQALLTELLQRKNFWKVVKFPSERACEARQIAVPTFALPQAATA